MLIKYLMTTVFCVSVLNYNIMSEAKATAAKDLDCYTKFAGKPSEIKKCVAAAKAKPVIPVTSQKTGGTTAPMVKSGPGDPAKDLDCYTNPKYAGKPSEIKKCVNAAKAKPAEEAPSAPPSCESVVAEAKLIIGQKQFPQVCSYTSYAEGTTAGYDAEFEKIAQQGLQKQVGIVETFADRNNWVLVVPDATKSDGVNRIKIAANVGLTPKVHKLGKDLDQNNANLVVKVRTPSDSIVTGWVLNGQVVCLSQPYANPNNKSVASNATPKKI